MRPESGILGIAVLCVALADLGYSKAAQAADDELTRQLSHQMATLIGAPDEGASIAIDEQSIDTVDLGSSWAFAPSDSFEPAPLEGLFATDDVVQGRFPASTDIGPGSAWNGAWTFQYATAARDLSGAATPRTVRTFDALTDHFWPLAEDGRSADVSVTFSEQFSADEATDDELLSPDTATAEGGEPDAPPGPANFRISESLKIKAQPVGGGLGGRVTFTFLLPTGAER